MMEYLNIEIAIPLWMYIVIMVISFFTGQVSKASILYDKTKSDKIKTLEDRLNQHINGGGNQHE